MHHWLQQPQDLVSARPNKTFRDRQTPCRHAGRHGYCKKAHASAGMLQMCSRLLFTGMQIGTVWLPSASLPNTSSTCPLCRTASPSWLQVPCWLISSKRRMRCGMLTPAGLTVHQPMTVHTHKLTGCTHTRTLNMVLRFCCFVRCAHTLQSICFTACA